MTVRDILEVTEARTEIDIYDEDDYFLTSVFPNEVKYVSASVLDRKVANISVSTVDGWRIPEPYIILTLAKEEE